MTSDEAFKAWRDSLATNERLEETSSELFGLLRTYARAIVWNYFRRTDPQLVQDIVTQAFLKAGSFSQIGGAGFGTWFYKLALNRCKDAHRRIRVRREVSLEDLLTEPVAPAPHSHRILSVLARLRLLLSKEDFEFVDLKLKGYENREIGEHFGLTQDGAKTRWKAIKHRIKRLIEAEDTKELQP